MTGFWSWSKSGRHHHRSLGCASRRAASAGRDGHGVCAHTHVHWCARTLASGCVEASTKEGGGRVGGGGGAIPDADDGGRCCDRQLQLGCSQKRGRECRAVCGALVTYASGVRSSAAAMLHADTAGPRPRPAPEISLSINHNHLLFIWNQKNMILDLY